MYVKQGPGKGRPGSAGRLGGRVGWGAGGLGGWGAGLAGGLGGWGAGLAGGLGAPNYLNGQKRIVLPGLF